MIFCNVLFRQVAYQLKIILKNVLYDDNLSNDFYKDIITKVIDNFLRKQSVLVYIVILAPAVTAMLYKIKQDFYKNSK